jgi:hypothetical protein
MVFAISVLQHRARGALDPALDEQLKVVRTRLVLIEAVAKRIAHAVEAEVLRAAAVRSVQKRAVRRGFIMTDP